MLRLLVLDSGVSRHYTVEIHGAKSPAEIIKWLRERKDFWGIHRSTSHAIYAEGFPPLGNPVICRAST